MVRVNTTLEPEIRVDIIFDKVLVFAGLEID
jgi:hypothetical protein